LLRTKITDRTSRFRESYASLPNVRGDAHRIEQVVINLIVNALDALTNDEQLVSLSSHFDEARRTVVVQVSDEGSGILPENMGRVTDPFFTTKRSSGGTGLGLSVSATIVRDHDGELQFEPRKGGGTTARMELPVHAQEPVEAT